MRSPRSHLIVLAVTAALLSALTVGAGEAQATPVDIVPTNPTMTPWDAVRSGGYTTPSGEALAQRLGYALDSSRPTLSASQAAYRDARLLHASQKANLIGRLRTVAPFVRFTVAGALVTTGLIVFEHRITDWLGNTHTEFIEFDRTQLGGASVLVPAAMTEGYDYRPDDDTFGWKWVDFPSGASSDTGFAFHYKMNLGWGDTSGGCSSNCKPLWTGGNDVTANAPKAPPYEQCGGAPYAPSICYGSASFGTTAGAQLAVGTAASLTLRDLEGEVIPMTVQLDADAMATGHVYNGQNTCRMGSPAVGQTCEVAYVPETRWDALVPRLARDAATVTPTGTHTTHVATLPDGTAWTTATDTLNDECGKAMFNHLAMPNTYPYFGCNPSAQDPDAGPTIPLESPSYTLPAPTANETAEAYRDRLEGLGHLGTITLSALDAVVPGYGPEAPVRVLVPSATPGVTRTLDPLQWPAPAPTVSKDDPITIRTNPPTAPEVPTDAAECVCDVPAVVFPTINTPCDKFPFGTFCWVADQLDVLFGQPADAPHISGDFPALSSGPFSFNLPAYGWDFADWDVDIEVYFGPIRLALGFLLWLGGLWFLGTRLLGIRGAPDTEGGVEMLD